MVRQGQDNRSDDGGKTWTALPVTAFTVAPNSAIDIVGIANDNPDYLYVRVEVYDNTLSDAIWRSFDAGLTWKQIDVKNTSIGAFVVRAALNRRGTHDLIAGAQALGAEISHDDGDTSTALANPPHMNCLVEDSGGTVGLHAELRGPTVAVRRRRHHEDHGSHQLDEGPSLPGSHRRCPL